MTVVVGGATGAVDGGRGGGVYVTEEGPTDGREDWD